MSESENEFDDPQPSDLGNESDLSWLRRVLGAADPGAGTAESNSDDQTLQQAAMARLMETWETGTQVEPATAPVQQRRRMALTGWLSAVASAAAMVLMGWWISGGWSSGVWHSNVTTPIAEKPRTDDKRSEHEKESGQPQTSVMDSLVDNTFKEDQPDALEARHLPSSVQGSQQVVSVTQLLDLPPRLVQVRLKQADRQALDQELVDWLTSWAEASPGQRQQLERQWGRNRQFWLAWSMQTMGQWEDPDVIAAGLEMICLDMGTAAKPFLERCLRNDRLAGAALMHWIPVAEDQQLTMWLAESRDCEQIRRVLQELVKRTSMSSTEALAAIASHSQCRVLLREIKDWNAVHRQRAVAGMQDRSADSQFHSAMLLAAIPDPDIDQLLVEQIRQGVGVVSSASLLMLRQQEESWKEVGDLPWARAALVSARQQVHRWKEQSNRSQSVFQKEVCEQCEENS